MKKTPLGFGTTEIEVPSLEDFKEKWVLITTSNGSYSGKLKTLENGGIILFPSQQINYSLDHPKYEIDNKEPLNLRNIEIKSYRGTTKKNTENFCKYMNRKSKLEYLEERSKISELESKFSK